MKKRKSRRYSVQKREGYEKHCTTPDTCAYENCRCSGTATTYYLIRDNVSAKYLSYSGSKADLQKIADILEHKARHE